MQGSDAPTDQLPHANGSPDIYQDQSKNKQLLAEKDAQIKAKENQVRLGAGRRCCPFLGALQPG
jgi:hypothetical protein